MKVHIPKHDEKKIGGGWTATRYLAQGLEAVSYEEADTYLITGPTLVSHAEVDQARRDKKRIILRVDNHLLPSRNRNTGMSRMKAFAEVADTVIYQSNWARDYLSRFTGRDGVVILNGVDTEFFRPGSKAEQYIYARSSRIEEKGWAQARYWLSRNHEGKQINIVGKFSSENLDYGFDFIGGEKFKFWGEQSRENFSSLLSQSKYFLYSYFMDACSNTLLEAKASGCEIIDVYGMLQTGGAPEIMACEDITLERMIRQYKEVLE
jgi:glycosyltransferase involved in cell wall biosynthesis